jgi:hypothetical protein
MIEIKTKAIQSASIQLMEAWKKNDYEGMNDLLHKDFQFVSAHIRDFKYNKLQWLDVAMNKYKILHYRYEFLNLTESDCVTISISHLSILSSVSFKDRPNKYLVTDLWKNEQNAWKILLRQPVLIL